MNKLEYLAFTATMIFAVCWIGNCCQAAASEESEVAVIYISEPDELEGVPKVHDLYTYEITCTNTDVQKTHEMVQEMASVYVEQPADIIEDPEESNEESEESSTLLYFGDLEITAYVETGNPCADGVYPSVGYTVASNDSRLWHKWIYIEGVGDRYVHDTGGMASNVIDLFVGSYSEAIQFGRQIRGVYVYEQHN